MKSLRVVRFTVMVFVIQFIALPPARAALINVTTAEAAQRALDRAKPGDEIVLEDGEYPDLTILASNNGNATAPIALRAETPAKVVLTGSPQICITGAHVELRGLTLANCARSSGTLPAILISGASNCRVTGCTFQHCYYEELPLVGIRDGASHNRVDHCRFLDTRYRCVVVTVDDSSLTSGPPIFNRIDHNLFQNVPPLGKNGGETIQLGQRSAPYSDCRLHTLIENNLFVRCNAEPEIISLKTSANTVRHNVFRDCQGEVVLRHGNNNKIEDNRFDGGLGGIRISGAGHHVIGNMVSNCRRTGIRLTYGTTDTMHPASYTPVHDCVVSSNTVLDCTEAAIHVGSMRNAHFARQSWTGPPWFASAIMDCIIAPRHNVIEDNILSGNEGVLLKLDHAPDNSIRNNLFEATGTATIGQPGENAVIALRQPTTVP